MKSAKRLETLAPNAGHLVHMPAHVYERVGNFAGAAAANEAGARADREFIKKYGNENMYASMYFNHNLDFGSASYAMIGDYANAKRLADEVSGHAVALTKMMGDLEAASIDTMKVLLRFNKFADILQMPEGRGRTPARSAMPRAGLRSREWAMSRRRKVSRSCTRLLAGRSPIRT